MMIPCRTCNQIHAGTDPALVGHEYTPKEGVGYVRLIVGPGPTIEYCWRCGCGKSGWGNAPNPVTNAHCTSACLCHTAAYAW